MVSLHESPFLQEKNMFFAGKITICAGKKHEKSQVSTGKNPATWRIGHQQRGGRASSTLDHLHRFQEVGSKTLGKTTKNWGNNEEVIGKIEKIWFLLDLCETQRS